MAAHHPRGAKTPEEGAFAVDVELWKVRNNMLSNNLEVTETTQDPFTGGVCIDANRRSLILCSVKADGK